MTAKVLWACEIKHAVDAEGKQVALDPDNYVEGMAAQLAPFEVRFVLRSQRHAALNVEGVLKAVGVDSKDSKNSIAGAGSGLGRAVQGAQEHENSFPSQHETLCYSSYSTYLTLSLCLLYALHSLHILYIVYIYSISVRISNSKLKLIKE
jgi:hypothetical protein